MAQIESSYPVETGLEGLINSSFKQLERFSRLALFTNHTGVLPRSCNGVAHFTSTFDILSKTAGKDVLLLIGGEHGVKGGNQADQGGNDDDGPLAFDSFGKTPEEIGIVLKKSQIDCVVVDIQDIGCRFYTFIWTLYDLLSSPNSPHFLILDRPPAVPSISPSGPVLQYPAFSSFVGRREIATAHAMTIGELSLFFAREYLVGHGEKRVEVVKLQRWSRKMKWGENRLPFIAPSPNMPSPLTAQLFPGTCMFEQTTLSEGRGTTLPFEILGAPWIDGNRWTTMIIKENELNEGGDCFGFRPCFFTPTFSKHASQVCGGIQVHVAPDSSPSPASVLRLGLILLQTAYKLSNETAPGRFKWSKTEDHESGVPYGIDRLMGSNEIREGIECGMHWRDIEAQWLPELENFDTVRRKYLLY